MFRNLVNECIIKFVLSAESPVSIRSGENLELDPSLPDNQFIRSNHKGQYDVVIPGSSIKGVFRSRFEKLIGGCCNVFDRECFIKTKDANLKIKDKYERSCPACKLFGSMSIKSRIEFKDAFPVENTVKMSTRHNVGIDRVTGAAKRGALFEPEILEEGRFKNEIILRNYFLWQLKTVFQIFNDINEGYVTFGGVTSRGFGKMSVNDIKINVREYGRGEPGEFFLEREIGFDQMVEKLKAVELSAQEKGKADYKNEYIF